MLCKITVWAEWLKHRCDVRLCDSCQRSVSTALHIGAAIFVQRAQNGDDTQAAQLAGNSLLLCKLAQQVQHGTVACITVVMSEPCQQVLQEWFILSSTYKVSFWQQAVPNCCLLNN